MILIITITITLTFQIYSLILLTIKLFRKTETRFMIKLLKPSNLKKEEYFVLIGPGIIFNILISYF